MKSDTEILVISGMSGAGKSTIAHTLEDLGWYVVDNLPPALLENLIDLVNVSMKRIAVVIDVRGRAFFNDLKQSLALLADQGVSRKILFIDASDEVLVRRFESTRRPHPLQGSDRILDGITKEREKLREVKDSADLVIDSSSLNIHQLEKKINEYFIEDSNADLRVNILSFGYKYGIPIDADLVVDCRFIANPHWNPKLRPLTGLDKPVSDEILKSENVQEFLSKYQALFETMALGFITEGRRYLTLAIGCTGGKHRSVAITQELVSKLTVGSKLSKYKIETKGLHRDLGREI
ncbi:MAG: RNase adapter RapZ [Candidatus Nanopelagicaceae bacterium]|nr:RNase adapter RapZ [Candidatus Nanopelagicaceae bacterium]